MARFHVGTSGWVYGDWRGRFYPEGLAQKNWLAYYADRFSTVELNATTYRLPKIEQVARWCETVPANFTFTIKLSRLITHRKVLSEKLDLFVSNYMERAARFGPRAAQILCQFPGWLGRNDEYLENFLDRLPAEHRYVVEFRNPSWYDAAIYGILRRRNIAFCIHDMRGARSEDIVTADFAYVRFHGYRGMYYGSYPKTLLTRRTRELAKVAPAADIYVYFNNDHNAAAPRDAAVFKSLLDAPSAV